MRDLSPPDRLHWVFFNPCGCPIGVIDHGDGVETSFRAWIAYYNDPAVEDAAYARGVTVTLMDHARYVAEVHPLMGSEYRCPHVTAGSSS